MRNNTVGNGHCAALVGNEGTINASNLSSGIYILEVKTENAHLTKKIVVR
ncbi:MAG: T9SS type A sorting domain-containing protein [Candidatus Limisoma sp.]